VRKVDEGEEFWRRFKQADRRATPEQVAEAQRAVQEHLSEYGYCYAAELIRIVLG